VSAQLPWLLLGAALAAALLTRAGGVVLSGRVEPETPLFDWFACVGQALVGGLMVRAIALPTSALANTPEIDRAVAVAAGFAVFFMTGRRLLAGTLAGVAALALAIVLRGG
jgi:branched-subunit amino acid transport protein